MRNQGTEWLSFLTYDPLPPLLNCGIVAIEIHTRKTLLDEADSLVDLWTLPEAQKVVNRQRSDGSWKYPANQSTAYLQECYDQYETFKNLGLLVEMYGFNKEHQAVRRAAEYFFSNQSNEGDFRGIYGNQYSPNYSAAIGELLIKGGYAYDAHIEELFRWLLQARQDDGGWALPFRTRGYGIGMLYDRTDTIQPDLSRPFSYMVTGVVLRAFAAHPEYRKSSEAHVAGQLLASSIYKKDNYPDRASPDYWLRFSFPFDYTNLISALDSLALIGFSAEVPTIREGLNWLASSQQKDGLWEFRIVRGSKRGDLGLWLALATCKIFKAFYEPNPR